MPSALRFTLLMFLPLAVCATPRLLVEDRVLHPVPPALFGQFLERASWGGEYGPEAVCDADGRLPAAVETTLAELRAPVVRFPFGTAGDYIDWQDLIDLPGRAERPRGTDHLGNTVANRFGYPEYFALARRMGWKTILVANLRDALYAKRPLAEAAEHAAALLRYGLEHAAPGSIAAFQIGNEGWFFWPPKPGERAALGIHDLDTASLRLREALVAYADAARRVSPDVPLICDAPRPDDAGGLENDAARVWRAAVDHPDIRARYTYLAAHAYAPMGNWSATRDGQPVDRAALTDDEVWFATLATLGRHDPFGQNIADARAYDEIAALGFRTAVTEWNWNGWNLEKNFPQITFRDGVPAALGSAAFLHGLMRSPRVALATQSMMLGTAWGITSVRVLPDGAVIHGPQAEAVRLYAEQHGRDLLASTLENVPVIAKPVSLASWWPQVSTLALLDVVVTASPDRLYIHAVNRDRTRPHSLEIVLPPTLRPAAPASLTTLVGDPATVTTTGRGRLVRTTTESALPLALPPASVSVIQLPITR